MTTKQRGQHHNVSRQRRFKVSDEQKEKMHEAAQEQVPQMSDVRRELQKKQRRAVALKRRSLWTEDHRKPCDEGRQTKRSGEQKIHSNEHGHLNKRKRNIADGGIDHLLILAQSAELLLESEDKSHCSYKNKKNNEEGSQLLTDTQLRNSVNSSISTDQLCMHKKYDATQVDANVEAGKSMLLLRGRTRLSQFRRQARLKNAQIVQEMHDKPLHGNLDCQSSGERAANCNFQKVQGMRSHQVHKELDCRPAALTGSDNFQIQEGMACKGADYNAAPTRSDNCQMQEGISCEGADYQCNAEFFNSQMVDEIHVDKLCKGTGDQADEASKEMNKTETYEGIHGDLLCREMDHQCSTAQKRKERIRIIGEQRELKKNGIRNAIPQRQLDVAGEVRQQLSPQQHIITQQLVQMSDELRQLKEQQRIARQLRVLRNNQRKEQLRKQHLNAAQQEQIRQSIEQMRVSIEKRKGEICGVEPQWLLQMSCMQKDHRDIARQRRLLRTFERRKQLRQKNHSAAQIPGHLMDDEQRRQIYEAEQQWLWQMSELQNEQRREAERQWLLQMSDIQKEKRRIEARQRRARRIEEQRASQNLHSRSNKEKLSEESNTDGGSHDQNVVLKGESCEYLLEVEHKSNQSTINESHEDQYVEQQPIATQVEDNVEVKKNMLCVKGRMRLNHLKCQARSINSHLVEKKHVRRMHSQSKEGS